MRQAARVNDDATARLAALKARLESDPRPRYVVSKDRMDHGPFTAVELLQQIASHAFTSDLALRDEISGEQLPIAEWEEFAPFALQTQLVREKRDEQKAVVRAVSGYKKRGIAKVDHRTIGCGRARRLAGGFGPLSRAAARAATRSWSPRIAPGPSRFTATSAERSGPPSAAVVPLVVVAGVAGARVATILCALDQEISIGQQAAGLPDLTDNQLSAPLRHASFVVCAVRPIV